ncbi:hypothetical protein MMC15_004129 [Xylographa vitiligo]|nr:hypothetical protein [Xylographa vitiligo]
MSIVFHKTLHSVNVCPGCETPCEALPDKDVECVSCGMMFRTIDELVKDKFARPLAAEPEGHSFRGIERQPIPMTMTAKRKRTEDDGDDEAIGFLIATSENDPEQTLLHTQARLVNDYRAHSGMILLLVMKDELTEPLLLDGVTRWRTLGGREYGLSFQSPIGFRATMEFLIPYPVPPPLPPPGYPEDFAPGRAPEWRSEKDGVLHASSTAPPPLLRPRYTDDIALGRNLGWQWEKSGIQGEHENRSVSPITDVSWAKYSWEIGAYYHKTRGESLQLRTCRAVSLPGYSDI